MGARPWKRTNEKGLEHGQPHHEQPQEPDSSLKGATLGTRTANPHAVHPNEENGSKSGDVNPQTIDDQGASQGIQRAKRDEQGTCQPENRSCSQWMKASETEAAVTEISAKMLEEKGDAIGLSTPLSSTAAEIAHAVGISPNGEDWVVVDDAINPDAPPLGRTSTGPGAGELRRRSFLLYVMKLLRASTPAGCPDTSAQAHGAQHPWLLSKHEGSGGAHLGGTDQRKASQEVGVHTPQNTPANVEEYRNLRNTSGEHSVVNQPQHVASKSSNVRRVKDEMETRPKNAYEPRFASLHSIVDIPQQPPKYSESPAQNLTRDSRVLDLCSLESGFLQSSRR